MSPTGSAEAPPANAGFTLLETVCAMAIIGLGVAIAMPGRAARTSAFDLARFGTDATSLLKADRVAALRRRMAVTARIAADGHGVEAGASTRTLHLPVDVILRLVPATGCGPDEVMRFDALGHSCGGALVLDNGQARVAVRVSPATGGVSLAAE